MAQTNMETVDTQRENICLSNISRPLMLNSSLSISTDPMVFLSFPHCTHSNSVWELYMAILQWCQSHYAFVYVVNMPWCFYNYLSHFPSFIIKVQPQNRISDVKEPNVIFAIEHINNQLHTYSCRVNVTMTDNNTESMVHVNFKHVQIRQQEECYSLVGQRLDQHLRQFDAQQNRTRITPKTSSLREQPPINNDNAGMVCAFGERRTITTNIHPKPNQGAVPRKPQGLGRSNSMNAAKSSNSGRAVHKAAANSYIEYKCPVILGPHNPSTQRGTNAQVPIQSRNAACAFPRHSQYCQLTASKKPTAPSTTQKFTYRYFDYPSDSYRELDIHIPANAVTTPLYSLCRCPNTQQQKNSEACNERHRVQTYNAEVKWNVHVHYIDISFSGICTDPSFTPATKFNAFRNLYANAICSLLSCLEAFYKVFKAGTPITVIPKSLCVYDLDETIISKDLQLLTSRYRDILYRSKQLFNYIVLWSHGISDHVYSSLQRNHIDPCIFDLIVSRPNYTQCENTATNAIVKRNKGLGFVLRYLNYKYDVCAIKLSVLLDDRSCNFIYDYDLFVKVPKFSFHSEAYSYTFFQAALFHCEMLLKEYEEALNSADIQKMVQNFVKKLSYGRVLEQQVD